MVIKLISVGSEITTNSFKYIYLIGQQRGNLQSWEYFCTQLKKKISKFSDLWMNCYYLWTSLHVYILFCLLCTCSSGSSHNVSFPKESLCHYYDFIASQGFPIHTCTYRVKWHKHKPFIGIFKTKRSKKKNRMHSSTGNRSCHLLITGLLLVMKPYLPRIGELFEEPFINQQ